MTILQRDEIRYEVRRAMALYPNAHLGDISPREDMRRAFRYIRQNSLAMLARDLDGYEDM